MVPQGSKYALQRCPRRTCHFNWHWTKGETNKTKVKIEQKLKTTKNIPGCRLHLPNVIEPFGGDTSRHARPENCSRALLTERA